MIDIGYKIPQIGQYILYILGGLLILSGVIIAVVSIIKSRKSSKIKEEKPHRRRSNKY